MMRSYLRAYIGVGAAFLACLVALLSFILFTSIHITVVRAEEEFVYDSKGKRDPFVPLIGEAYVLSDAEDLELSELILEGVIFDPASTSFVLINGKTLEEGHVIGGFVIVRIFEDGVVVEKADSQHTLRIKTLGMEPT